MCAALGKSFVLMVATHLKHYMSINNDISHYLADTSLLATKTFVVEFIVTHEDVQLWTGPRLIIYIIIFLSVHQKQ